MLNTIIITGHVCSEPQKINDRLLIFRLANNGYKKDESNTLFIQVNAWDKLADRVYGKIKQGSFITVRGRLQLRTYLDKSETRQKSFEIVADAIDFLDRKKDDEMELPAPIDNDELADNMLEDDWDTIG